MRVGPFLCVLLLLLVLTSASSLYDDQNSFEGLSISTYDVFLRSLTINAFMYANYSTLFSLSSEFDASGSGLIVDVHFVYGDGTAPIYIGSASALVDVVYYYASGDGRNYEFGTYFKRIVAVPQNFTSEVFYRLDLREEANNVLSYFSSKVSNLTIEDVGFLGRIFLKIMFANATSSVGSKDYVRFSLTCDGNMTSVTPDVTVPDEADIIDAAWGSEDMARIIPTRVQTSFSVSPTQRVSKEVYVAWRMPEPPPPEPWYEGIPWRYLIPAFVGAVVTLLIRDVVGRPIYRYLASKKVAS